MWRHDEIRTLVRVRVHGQPPSEDVPKRGEYFFALPVGVARYPLALKRIEMSSSFGEKFSSMPRSPDTAPCVWYHPAALAGGSGKFGIALSVPTTGGK